MWSIVAERLGVSYPRVLGKREMWFVGWEDVSHCWGEDTVPYGGHHSVSDKEEVLGNLFLPKVCGFCWLEEPTESSEHQGEGHMKCFVVFSQWRTEIIAELLHLLYFVQKLWICEINYHD